MDDMEGKIVLDRKSFEALAVDSRVRILKSLKERRKTLSEISKEQKMSLSGVKEHLETLERVGLVEKIDDGHKWKYYELTKKGMDIVAPRELRVWILLSLSTIALVASMFFLFPTAEIAQDELYTAEAPVLDEPMGAAAPMMAVAETDMDAEYADFEEKRSNEAEALEAPEPEEPLVQTEELPVVPTAVAAISAVTLIACLAILIRNRIA